MVVCHNKIAPPLLSSFKVIYAIWSGPYKAGFSKCLVFYSNWEVSLMGIGLIRWRMKFRRKFLGLMQNACLKQCRTLWSLPHPHVLSLHFVCRKKFCQRVSFIRFSPGGTSGKEPAFLSRRQWFNPWVSRSPRGEMATHSSIPAWRIPMHRGAWQATVMGSERVGHGWSYLACWQV